MAMKMNSIVNRYIFKEMIPPFFISLGFLSFVFLLAQILEITNLIVNYNASIVSMLLLVVFYTPEFLQFTIPMSVMMAVLLTFLKMSSDNEVIAIKAGGGNIYHLVFPVFLFTLIGFTATIIITIYGLVWGHDSYEQLVVDIASKSADAALKEGVFNDSADGLMLYVNKIDMKNKLLYDVFINDSRNEKNRVTTIAPKAKRFLSKDNSSIILRLFDGVTNKVNIDDKSVSTISFGTSDFEIPLKRKEKNGKTSKSRKAKNIKELKEFAATTTDEVDSRTAQMEMHKRFALPVACFALGLLAMPLGLKSAFSKKSSGLGLGLVCFLLYYFLLGIGLSLGKNGVFPPGIAIWMPDIIMGIIGIVFLIRVSKEKSVGFGFGFVTDLIGSLYSKIKNRAGDK